MKKILSVLVVAFMFVLCVSPSYAANVKNYFAQPNAAGNNVLNIGGTENINSGGAVEFKSGSTLTISAGATVVSTAAVFMNITGAEGLTVTYGVTGGSLTTAGNASVGGTLTQTGVATFTAMPVLNGGADINEDVDIDFDARDEEFNISQSSQGLIVATIYNSSTDLDPEDTALLSLDYKDNGDANGIFLQCRDNTYANTVLKIGADGAITIDASGAGSGTVLSEGTLIANDAAFRIDSETQDLQIGDGTNNTVFGDNGAITQTGSATTTLATLTVTAAPVMSAGKIGYTDSQSNLNYDVIVSTTLAVDIAFPITPADGKAGSFIVQMGTHTATGTFTSAAVVSLGLSTSNSAGTDAGIGLAVYDGGAAIVYIKNKTAATHAATIRYSYVN